MQIDAILPPSYSFLQKPLDQVDSLSRSKDPFERVLGTRAITLLAIPLIVPCIAYHLISLVTLPFVLLTNLFGDSTDKGKKVASDLWKHTYKVVLYVLGVSNLFCAALFKPIESTLTFRDWKLISPPTKKSVSVSKEEKTMGLPNTDNTCWFNSLLKFMATTDKYDKPTDPFLSRLHLALDKIRTSKTESLMDKKTYDALYNELLELHPNKTIKGAQFDPTEMLEFIREISNLFPPQELDASSATEKVKRTCVQTAKHYKNLSDECITYKEPRIESNFLPQIVIKFGDDEIGLDNKKECDIQTRMKMRDEIEAYLFSSAAPGSPNYPFIQEQVNVHLPELLTIYLDRGIQGDGPKSRVAKNKCFHDIKFDDKGCLSLIEHGKTPTTYEDKRATLLPPLYRCTYQVEGAIVHEGGGTGGHYVFFERTADGTILKHNDSRVSTIPESEANWKQALLLRLRRVEKTDLSDDEKEKIIDDFLNQG